MRRSPGLLAVLLVTACAGASDPGPATAEVVPPPTTPTNEPRGDAGPPPTKESDPVAPPRTGDPSDACASARARYLELRSRQDHCTRDDECAEIYPGPCPEGPYYVHVTADPSALDEAEAALFDVCEEAECEMPMPLGIAHCEAGRCKPGRAAPTDGPKSSCWDTKVTYMDPGRPYLDYAYEHLQGITPLHAVGVPARGTLRISAHLGCADCKLLISEHNTGMARLVEGTPFTPEPKDPTAIGPVPSRSPPVGAKPLHLEVPVTPGSYYLAAIGQRGDVQLEVSLLDAEGRAMAPDHHGVIHLRICED